VRIEQNRDRPVPSAPGTRSLGVAAIEATPIFCEGLSTVIHRTPGLHWLGTAGTHHNALQLAEQLRPDIFILDSALDPNSHLTRLLTSFDPASVVVVLVRDANRSAAFLSAASAAGMHAAVPRTVDPRKLTEAIRRARAEHGYLDPGLALLTSRQKRAFAHGSRPAARMPMPLSRREYQVLHLVAEGLENSAIAKILFLSVETVRTHVKSILRKLSARDRTHAVTIAFRGGILIAETEEKALAADSGNEPATPKAHEC
jgi:DNA-binding NarL/FixJ family response regulator